jgi:ribosomal protein S18 acetylase RimI-like enzyme
VRVRPVTSEDLPSLLALGQQLRQQLLPTADPRGRASSAELETRYLDAIADPDRHLVLAVQGDPEQVLGMAIFTVTSSNPLLDIPAVQVTHTVVSPKHRKRGAGRALVAAAAGFAEERGIDQLVVSVDPTSRDAARFFARLGFAPLAVRRIAPVSVVRRRLAFVERAEEPVGRRRALRPVPSRRASGRPRPSLDSGV